MHSICMSFRIRKKVLQFHSTLLSCPGFTTVCTPWCNMASLEFLHLGLNSRSWSCCIQQHWPGCNSTFVPLFSSSSLYVYVWGEVEWKHRWCLWAFAFVHLCNISPTSKPDIPSIFIYLKVCKFLKVPPNRSFIIMHVPRCYTVSHLDILITAVQVKLSDGTRRTAPFMLLAQFAMSPQPSRKEHVRT